MRGRLERFVDAHPRTRATVIAALAVVIWAFDVPRIGVTRDLLGDRWAGVLGWGLGLGNVLAAVVAGAWFVRRRFAVAVAAVALCPFLLTHPRHGDDGIMSEADLIMVVGGDIVFGVVLLGLAGHTFRREPVRS
ncbi:hypothetical protein GUY44_27610 [Pimelobacter simplex]|uniref:Uncharacterized protein n=1 Tax=Nocardioides simplex TaxID=2045 RepID=A0A0A1DJ32_NOCSI|nr:hypothetical protein [Pimelobacter simplex]AIY16543.1 hypothetical protein KR76_06770 [Pimelobacter simplex]MCG8154268.1 hypothetical protein [Pimelobacter simplex]GEB11714.1 hypothetical protein NSI01_00290 [Pimelobacter simplex]SFN00786.1 hypothetical protein SAMN05421671_4575 [Pimelobacter simplex]